MTRRFRTDRVPLRVKLVAALVLLVAVALGATGVATTTAMSGYLVGRIDDQLVQQGVEFARHAGDQQPGRPPLGGDHGRAGFEPPSAYDIVVSDAAGNPVGSFGDVGSTTDTHPTLPTFPIAQARAKAGDPFDITVRTDDGSGRWRAVVQPLADGSGSVTLAAPLDNVQRTTHRLVLLELAIGGIVLVLLAGVGYVIVRRSLRPLVEVERTAEAIAGGDLTRRVPDRDPRTEVGRLSVALNTMLSQIEDAFRTRAASEAAARGSAERMRRFVADASHELRTPLTSIRGFAELYRQGAVAAPDEVARVMRRIEDEAARMGLLVEDLLLLARLDQQRPLEQAPVDLLAVATDAVLDAQAVAPQRPIALDVRSPSPPVVVGDDARLRQVVGNLVTNALTHTPPDAAVTVRVATRTEPDGRRRAVLEVADSGPGLAPADADRVFERFYRADASRTRSRGGGSGLGLSIVAALVTAHGGNVEVDSTPGKGATFRVLLPLDQAPTPIAVAAGPQRSPRFAADR